MRSLSRTWNKTNRCRSVRGTRRGRAPGSWDRYPVSSARIPRRRGSRAAFPRGACIQNTCNYCTRCSACVSAAESPARYSRSEGPCTASDKDARLMSKISLFATRVD